MFSSHVPAANSYGLVTWKVICYILTSTVLGVFDLVFVHNEARWHELDL